MKTNPLLLIAAAFVLLSGFKQKPEGPHTVIFSFYSGDYITCTDTLIIPYQLFPRSAINDSLRRFLKGNGSSVTRMLFVQPTLVIDSVDFSLFPELRELRFTGDPDVLEDRKYAFMDAPKLHVIRAYAIYCADTLDPYALDDRGVQRFKELIRKHRPDVKVKRLRNGLECLEEW
jgi:hypothetical protein